MTNILLHFQHEQFIRVLNGFKSLCMVNKLEHLISDNFVNYEYHMPNLFIKKNSKKISMKFRANILSFKSNYRKFNCKNALDAEIFNLLNLNRK